MINCIEKKKLLTLTWVNGMSHFKFTSTFSLISLWFGWDGKYVPNCVIVLLMQIFLLLKRWHKKIGFAYLTLSYPILYRECIIYILLPSPKHLSFFSLNTFGDKEGGLGQIIALLTFRKFPFFLLFLVKI